MSITTICQVLEVGSVRRDSGALFGEVAFESWREVFVAEGESITPGRDKRIKLPANVLVIRTEAGTILVDTGTPAVHEEQTSEDWTHSRLRGQLRSAETTIKGISKVIITSFDIDHAGGLTHLDRTGKLIYSFPHAEVFYHAHTSQRQRPRTVANAAEATEMLVENDHHPCWEATEILPGITLHPVIGPSWQGSVVEVNRGAERLLYLGDLCPTVYHISPSIIPAFDDNPEATFSERTHWITLAMKEGYKVIFGHGNKIKAAWLENTKRGLAIRPA